MTQPLVAPLVALAAGIWAARFADFTPGETLLSCSLLALLAVATVSLRLARGGMWACLTAFFLTGALLAPLPDSDDPRTDPHLITHILERKGMDWEIPVRLRGWVREPPEDLLDADRFVLELESVFRSTPARGGVRVTVNREPGDPPLDLHFGERIEFLARLRRLHNFQNPGSFDFVGYMARRGIFVSGTVRAGVPIHRLEGERGSRAEAFVWRAREWARGRFADVMGDGEPRAVAVLDAMLLGIDEALDRETKDDFQRTGTYHVLVVSGMQLGLLAFLVLRFLRSLSVPPALCGSISVLFGFAYAALVGSGVPVWRSAWMLSAYLATVLVYRQRRALNVIAGTALVFLVADPELLFDAGFQLTFVSVALIAGIAVPLLSVTVEPWKIATRDLWNRDRDLHADPIVASHRVAMRTWFEPLAVVLKARVEHVAGPLLFAFRLLLWAIELVVISMIVQAGLAVPMAAYFQRISWSGVIVNLMIVPLLSLAIPAGLFAVLTGWKFLGDAALQLTDVVVDVTHWFAENLPLETRVPAPPSWLAVLIGIAFVMTVIACERQRRRMVSLGICGALVAVLMIHPFAPAVIRGVIEMSAIDVGQGDAIFLGFPDGGTMLIDGGGQPDFRDPDDPPSRRQPIDIGEEVVSPYLWSRSIRSLDVLAITHGDSDHIGGIPSLLRNFVVRELWLGRQTFPEEYESIRALAARRGTTIREIAEGEHFDFGGTRIDVLGPPSPPSPGRNDLSLVLALRYGEQRFLLTGDIQETRERVLVNSGDLHPTPILKIAHHGSRTSSIDEFLHAVRPTFAIISAGLDNFYGHPSDVVLQRLSDAHIRILRTDQEGLISVTSDGRRIAVDTFHRQRQGSRP